MDKEVRTELENRLLEDLRWYGKTIAGGGPMIGYAVVARRAERHWYDVTLPMLYELNAVYSDATQTLLSGAVRVICQDAAPGTGVKKA
jgi:hypothetical protein